MVLQIHPIQVDKKFEEFDLFDDLIGALTKNKIVLENGDIIIISSKYVSNSQGRVLNLKKIKVNPNAKQLAKKYHMSPSLAEVITRESDKIFGGISGFVMALTNDIFTPNAGIDKSNSKKDTIILYPSNPFEISENLRRKFFLQFSLNVGIIIIDSRLMPSRIGTIGVAISCSGIEPIKDMRSHKDLNGNPLKVTMQAVADSLATIANHVMGEGSECKPYVIIKQSNAILTDRKISSHEFAIAHDQCVYVRSLKN